MTDHRALKRSAPAAISNRANSWRTSLFATLFRTLLCAASFSATLFAFTARADKLTLPPEGSATLDKIYSFDLNAAIADAQHLQTEYPDRPLGYLLEADALWWQIFCTSAEFKYGMTDARHRAKLPADQHYLDLAAKASSIALDHLKIHESAEMHFYAGMADAAVARLYGLRGENRATARAGVHAREHFLRAIQLNPELVDAEFGLGLYNYYVDTLSAVAKFLGFFMGIPGGNKQEGIRQLEHDAAQGVLTPSVARFYLALDLHRAGTLQRLGVEMLGASPLAIAKAEDRALFKEVVAKVGLESPQSDVAHSTEEAWIIARRLGFPVILRLVRMPGCLPPVSLSSLRASPAPRSTTRRTPRKAST